MGKYLANERVNMKNQQDLNNEYHPQSKFGGAAGFRVPVGKVVAS